MNCWFWIILLWLFGGNGGCQNDCMCARNRDRDHDHDHDSDCHDHSFPTQNTGCGCGNDMIQPRGFAGFGDNNTCGCEEKEK